MSDFNEKDTSRTGNRERLYMVLCLILVVAIVGVWVTYPKTSPDAAPEPPAAGESVEAAAPEPVVITREVEKIVEVEREITVETLRDGLNEMGYLITEEYYFTDLMGYTSFLSFFRTDIPIPFTESSYLVSYDGVVSAGMDLSAARVEKDDEHKRVTVRLPAASIKSVDIDLNSFQLREEKTGLGNPISVRDFNSSLQELENAARQKAVERGLLEKADENARVVVSRFVWSLLDASEYQLIFASS